MKSLWLVIGSTFLAAACSTETRFVEISPPNGTFTGGEEVQLEGANFPRSGVTVRFGTKEATGVVVLSDHAIQVTTPAGERGTAADVTLVFDDGRAFVLKGGFHYVDATQQRDTMDKAFKKMSEENGGKKQ